MNLERGCQPEERVGLEPLGLIGGSRTPLLYNAVSWWKRSFWGDSTVP